MNLNVGTPEFELCGIHDLKSAFPDMSGFSPRNLKYMRKFAQAWPNREIVQRTVAQIPWRSQLTSGGKRR